MLMKTPVEPPMGTPDEPWHWSAYILIIAIALVLAEVGWPYVLAALGRK